MDFPKTHFELMEEHYRDYLNQARQMIKKHGWKGYFYWVATLQKHSVPALNHLDGNYLGAIKNKQVDQNAKEGGAFIRALFEHFVSAATDPFDMGQIVETEEFKAFYTCFDSTTGIGNQAPEWQAFSMMLNKAWHEVCHELAGRRVYQISPGLAQRLKNTELRGLSSSDIRLPYKAIYLTIPAEAKIQVYNEQTQWHRAIGIYLIETEQKLGDRTWSLLAIGSSKSSEPLDDALIFFKVFLPANLPMTDILKINEEAQKQIYQKMTQSFGNHSAFDYIISQWRTLFTFCMNTVVYATWPDAEKFEALCNPDVRKALEKMKRHPKNSRQYQKAHSIVRSQDPTKRIVLGRSLPLLETEPSEKKEGKPLTIRTLVQGHWHSYWTGEGRTTKIWKFVQPYWKGPDIVPESEARHILV